jgi:hypothetical protein
MITAKTMLRKVRHLHALVQLAAAALGHQPARLQLRRQLQHRQLGRRRQLAVRVQDAAAGQQGFRSYMCLPRLAFNVPQDMMMMSRTQGCCIATTAGCNGQFVWSGKVAFHTQPACLTPLR